MVGADGRWGNGNCSCAQCKQYTPRRTSDECQRILDESIAAPIPVPCQAGLVLASAVVPWASVRIRFPSRTRILPMGTALGALAAVSDSNSSRLLTSSGHRQPAAAATTRSPSGTISHNAWVQMADADADTDADADASPFFQFTLLRDDQSLRIPRDPFFQQWTPCFEG